MVNQTISLQEAKTIWTTREVADAAATVGKPVTQEYIRQLCKRGVIPTTRPGRDWLIADHDAQAWLGRWLSKGTT